MSRRFIVVVIDSFGVGAMADVAQVRVQDMQANTALHVLGYPVEKQLPTFMQLGLMNIVDCEIDGFKKAETAVFGSANLQHYGADSFFGHQEIMGTNPQKPVFSKLSKEIDSIEQALMDAGYTVRRVERVGKQILSVNESMMIGDNLETDLGQAINVIGAIDLCGFEDIQKVGSIVRKQVQVARVIAFGGSEVTYQDLLDHIQVIGDYIGVDAPGSGVYKHKYQVVHLGYGVDAKEQLPYTLAKQHIPCYFYGKVADIVENPFGKNTPGVDSAQCFEALLDDLKQAQTGFYCLNIQETDLAGHAQDAVRYLDRLQVCDQYLAVIMSYLDGDDVLLVCADHGNDPTIGHAKHTREKVPILISSPKMKAGLIAIPERATLADIGATVAAYFACEIQYGTSFLETIME